MSWVLRRSGGGIVARPGLRFSYTNSEAKAATFSTREAAEGNACGNETAIPNPWERRRLLAEELRQQARADFYEANHRRTR